MFTVDNQLDKSTKRTKNQRENYQKLHQQSEAFLSELKEAFHKEADITNIMKPVNTIPDCRDLSKKILTNQRNITSRVYKLLFPDEEEIGSATDAVAEEGEELEEEKEETLENLRAQLAQSQEEVTALRGELKEVRGELDEVFDYFSITILKWRLFFC